MRPPGRRNPTCWRERSTRRLHPSSSPSPHSRTRSRSGGLPEGFRPAFRAPRRPPPLPLRPERLNRRVASGRKTPPGWERIHEGSFLEAVLLTQLSGDFPGPVLAMVSVPFHSADRQRVLIPRGARVVGTARAVEDRDQSRLAVAFHRLLLPGGSWIDLEFTA